MEDKQSIFIVADDLTGSADAANYFRTAERRVRVSFLPDSPWDFSLGTDVVQVFDSESRGLDLQMAKQRIAEAGQQLAHSGNLGFSVYKKVDSTLRGHIGGEMEALLRGLGRRVALLAPAFPANGRTVHEGKLLVNGVPVSQTAIARDPHNPVTYDTVADIVRQTTTLPVVELNHALITQGLDAVERFLEQVTHFEAVIVADADSDRDLSVLAQAVARNTAVIPCGSAGLARQLADIWCHRESAQSMAYQPPACTRVLVAVGSANPVSHEQLSQVTSNLPAPAIALQPVELADPTTRDEEMTRGEREVQQTNTSVVAVTLAKERALRNPNLPGSFESDLAQVACRWLQQEVANGTGDIGFVATGGDTALALCKALSAKAIWPEGEVLSGMPWSHMETEHGQFPIVSKAGGFGNPDALQQAIAFLMK